MATTETVKATKDGQEAEFVRSAYESVWKDKGWTLVEDDQPVQQNAQAAQDSDTPATPPQQRQAPAAAKKDENPNR